jgi:hypothetical protein
MEIICRRWVEVKNVFTLTPAIQNATTQPPVAAAQTGSCVEY